eukprot:CAMPEP_0181168718 /NCGR_PEP_ID=MMETSP1096-20121128/424_1 /TAXON_ID=156174 ORGANISM="Chrysochromulina ericina, Strain CCMP281" /NCGR_SAMPLE_ID=MMETSP1096 /ASSEMBLY_ACC=CAM_ASM_000453 /LENGTH=194 /DNA_ID=CAMNT_0023256115 /DNA_START=249 /DNA_END=836 /DNA_ORIENTATION=+
MSRSFEQIHPRTMQLAQTYRGVPTYRARGDGCIFVTHYARAHPTTSAIRSTHGARARATPPDGRRRREMGGDGREMEGDGGRREGNGGRWREMREDGREMGGDGWGRVSDVNWKLDQKPKMDATEATILSQANSRAGGAERLPIVVQVTANIQSVAPTAAAEAFRESKVIKVDGMADVALDLALGVALDPPNLP